VAVARTSGRGVAGVVGEVRGTDMELVEVKAGADPAGGGPSTWRRSRGEEDSTRGAAATRRGTPDHVSARMVGRRGARGRGEARGGDVGPGGWPEAAGGIAVFTAESGRRQLWVVARRWRPVVRRRGRDAEAVDDLTGGTVRRGAAARKGSGALWR
jgi:hypothetical protein